MNTVNKKVLYLISSISVFISSCEKYLEEKNDSSLVIPKTITDLQGILDDYVIMNSKTVAFSEATSDDYFLTENNYNSLIEEDRQAYTWQLQDYTYQNDWSNCYSAVYNSNYCLEQIDKIPITSINEADWKNVKGSALFFRAYYYLNLVWTFSKAYDENTSQTDLGIVLRFGSDFNVPSVRASVKESYNQIIQDLKESTLLLPTYPIKKLTQPSKVAALSLLARSYLSMRKYDSAYKYANQALSIKSDLLDYNSAEVGSGNIPFQPFNKEIIFYSIQWGSFAAKHPTTGTIDTILYGSYQSNDKRKSVYFRNNGSYKRFKGSYASSSTNLFTGIGVDEIFLIRAECNAREGRITEALADLNILLSQRWITGTFTPIVSSSQQEVLAKILEERRKELLMRGLRWIDIKRLNKENANIHLRRIVGTVIFELPPNDKKYALPLPKDIIEITGIPQN